MSDEIALNSAQVEAIRRGYTILSTVGGYYIRLYSGVKYESEHDNDYINVDPRDFATIEEAAVETTSEEGTDVALFYDDEDGWDFYEVTMDEFEEEEVLVADDYVMSNGMSSCDRKRLSKPSSMKYGLAATWSNHEIVVGIKDVAAGYGSREKTDSAFGTHMGMGIAPEDAAEMCEAIEDDISDAIYLSTEELLFEAWKQCDDGSAETAIEEALYILGYSIEPTGHELVAFDES